MNEAPAAGKSPPELVLRILSALVLIAVVLTATWYGGPVFVVLCVCAASLVLIEFLQIVRQNLSADKVGLAVASLIAVVAIWYVAGPRPAMLTLGACFVLLLAYEGLTRRSFWAAGGLAYAALPLFALVMLRGGEAVGLHAVFFIFACVWGADTLAYFAGRAIGGPKLAPAISPKKTWAGFFGGLAGSVIAAGAVLVIAGYALSVLAIVLMIVLSVVSQVGDLFESWIKRRFGKKDSGRIIPGHGGILDRIDGLIFVSVAAWLAGGLASGEALVPAAAARGLFAAFILP